MIFLIRSEDRLINTLGPYYTLAFRPPSRTARFGFSPLPYIDKDPWGRCPLPAPKSAVKRPYYISSKSVKPQSAQRQKIFLRNALFSQTLIYRSVRNRRHTYQLGSAGAGNPIRAARWAERLYLMA